MSTANDLDLEACPDLQALIGDDPAAVTENPADPTADTTAPPSRHHTFGNLAVRNGFLSPQELRECLRHQKHLRRAGVERKPGEIMVERGHLAQEHVDALLTLQRERPAGAPAAAPARPSRRVALLCNPRFGRMLLEHHLIGRDQLRECIGIQRALNGLGYNLKLGEVLLLRGDLSHGAIEALLTLQRARTDRCRRRVFQWATAAALVAAVLAGAVTRAVAGREDDPVSAAPTLLQSPGRAAAAAPSRIAFGLRVGPELAPAEPASTPAEPAVLSPLPEAESLDPDPELERRRSAEAEVLRRECLLFPAATHPAAEESDPDILPDAGEDGAVE